MKLSRLARESCLPGRPWSPRSTDDLDRWYIIVATEAHMRVIVTAIAVAALFSAPTFAQWSNAKTAGIPRLADGKPNLAAPAPRTADAKPDLTGIWQAGRAGAGGQYGFDYNVAQNLPADALTPWAQSVRQKRVQDFRKDSPLAHCLPV